MKIKCDPSHKNANIKDHGSGLTPLKRHTSLLKKLLFENWVHFASCV